MRRCTNVTRRTRVIWLCIAGQMVTYDTFYFYRFKYISTFLYVCTTLLDSVYHRHNSLVSFLTSRVVRVARSVLEWVPVLVPYIWRYCTCQPMNNRISFSASRSWNSLSSQLYNLYTVSAGQNSANRPLNYQRKGSMQWRLGMSAIDEQEGWELSQTQLDRSTWCYDISNNESAVVFNWHEVRSW